MTGKSDTTPVIVVQISDGQSVELRCKIGELLIGRSPECDLILPDPSVSRKHARIVGTNFGFYIEDTSTNGTFIGGKRIKRKNLSEDTDISIGPFILHFKFTRHEPEPDHEIPTELVHDHKSIEKTSEAGHLPRQTASEILESLGMVWKSKAIENVVAMMEKIARTDFPVLITGETGTGKELIARGIHALSGRKNGPFVALNCGAISPELVESELFGHEKGAFTGAHTQRKGAFEIAQGGTLFLDEIGEMPFELQVKLLRALEQKEIRRIGGNKTIKVNARIVSATNRNLSTEISLKKFREDLYYRLNSLPLHIPPLRERPDDIPPLADHFLKRFNEEFSENKKLTRKAREVLLGYPWPGNVRELRNVIQRAAVLSEAENIDGDLVSYVLSSSEFIPSSPSPQMPPNGTLRKVDAYEREIILRELQNTGWNKTQAAKNLGIAKSTLFEKLKKYGIKNPD